jgi:hypothetical protein
MIVQRRKVRRLESSPGELVERFYYEGLESG